MSDLERQAQAVLTPMICDESTVLDPLQQDAVAVWATKTVLVAARTAIGGSASMPAGSYAWFGQHRRPLSGSIVWIGRYAGTGQWPYSFQKHGMVFTPASAGEPPEDAPINGFHAIFSVGYLALCVFVADVPDGPIVTAGSDRRRHMIWPVVAADVAWPPERSFETDEEMVGESRCTPDGGQDPVHPGPAPSATRP